jgi:hypothetical protein
MDIRIVTEISFEGPFRINDLRYSAPGLRRNPAMQYPHLVALTSRKMLDSIETKGSWIEQA